MNQAKLNLIIPADAESPVHVGRYLLHRQIARGGMATIHIARLMGDEGFSRIVAAKRLHPEFAEDSEFACMFLDEARIASKVHHRNVVPVLDVVAAGDEVILVQEYVHGAPLQWLLKRSQQAKLPIPLSIAVSIGCQILAGLHATHETVDELGEPMHIVHRDVSPHNVMIAMDGTARLLDFGVAQAVAATHTTRDGTYKGKLAYSAPEQLRGAATRQSDVYSLSVLLWELLVAQRMHGKKSGAELLESVLHGARPTIREALSAEGVWDTISEDDRRGLLLLDPIVRKGLAVDTGERWASAYDMEEAIAAVARPASLAVVSTWLKAAGRDFIEKRDNLIAAEEASWRRAHPGGGRTHRGAVPFSSGINLRVPAADKLRTAFGRKDAVVALLCALLSMLATVVSVTLVRHFGRTEASLLRAPPTVAPRTEIPVPHEVKAVQPVIEQLVKPVEVRAPVPRPVVQSAHAAKAESEPRPHGPAASARPDRSPRRPRVSIARPAPADSASARPEAHAPPPSRAENDCATPYYFEGSKKVFKPACI